MLDSFSFFHQLGPAAESVFKSIRSGFDERVEMIDNANEFMQSIVSQKDIQDWERSKHTFKVEGGELTLTVSQIMELYTLSKREQARDQLLLGGIRSAGFESLGDKLRTLVVNSLMETNLGMPYVYLIFIALTSRFTEQIKRRRKVSFVERIAENNLEKIGR